MSTRCNLRQPGKAFHSVTTIELHGKASIAIIMYSSPVGTPGSFIESPTRLRRQPLAITTPQRGKRVSFGHVASPDSISFVESGSHGMDNLANELAGAWDDDDLNFDEGISGVSGDLDDDQLEEPPVSPFKFDVRRLRDSGIDVTCSTCITPTKSGSSSIMHSRKTSLKDIPELPFQTSKNLSTPSEDQEMERCWRSIDVCLNDLAKLTACDASQEHLEGNSVVKRTIDRLRELGDQSRIETNISGLMNAYDTMSVQLSYETRSFQTYAYAGLGSIVQTMDEGQYQGLLSEVASVLSDVPRSTALALSSLAQLNKASRDVIDTIKCLSDNLHMSRQTTEAVARRLKMVKELVTELYEGLSVFEESRRWVEEGDWEARLARRESATICDDIISGFSEVCDTWRAKLTSGGGVQVAC